MSSEIKYIYGKQGVSVLIIFKIGCCSVSGRRTRELNKVGGGRTVEDLTNGEFLVFSLLASRLALCALQNRVCEARRARSVYKFIRADQRVPRAQTLRWPFFSQGLPNGPELPYQMHSPIPAPLRHPKQDSR